MRSLFCREMGDGETSTVCNRFFVGRRAIALRKGAFYLKSLPKPANQREAIAGVLSVMRSTAQPFRVPDPNAPYVSSTRWRTVAALTEKLYMYESSLYPTLIWLDAKKIDFKEGSGVRAFDLTKNREAIGDVSEKLTPDKDLFGNNLSE